MSPTIIIEKKHIYTFQKIITLCFLQAYLNISNYIIYSLVSFFFIVFCYSRSSLVFYFILSYLDLY